MSLKIETTDWGLHPVVICDQCGEPIHDAREGNLHWQADADEAPERRFAFFTHKWCCAAFEQGRGGAASWYAMELSDLLPGLAASLRPGANANRGWPE
ncbi:MAG: hypothetical protein IT337_11805, partial [Thermomicrobiales bacterium]|nr:hypothetical protein [Thermomicrobiales bacterium]